MRDRDREALARACDDAALEPMRTAFRMRRDDHLVGAEGPEGVLDRLQRIAVADLGAGPVLVGGPVADRAVQRRRHDENLGVVTLAAATDLAAERLAADGLVR